MGAWAQLRSLNAQQWRAFTAAYLGWTLDAFDYFLLVMVMRHIAADFHVEINAVTSALFLTLAFRPVGAILFGYIADRFGRRPALMGSILLFAGTELLSGFAPTLGSLLVLRAVFGIGMGGEWGVGASLAMESVPAQARGILSGILQQGYPVGYLLAALAYAEVFPHFGWRGIFILGVVPAILVVFVRMGVAESPAWVGPRPGDENSYPAAVWSLLKERWPLLLYMAVLMAVFNSFSHGSQDLYPSAFLEQQKGLPAPSVSRIVMIASLGAVAGGIFFGALSQRIGRRLAMASAALLALPAIPLWIGGASPAGLALGAFLVQFAVQGAWGIVPAHLNELSPSRVRGILPGLSYQLGNLLASRNASFQAVIAARHGGNYGLALGGVVAGCAVALACLALAGPEARDAQLASADAKG